MRNLKFHGLRGIVLWLVMGLGAGLASLPFAVPALAQAVVVTEAQVLGFIASYPDVRALADELGEQQSGGSDDDVAALGALLGYQGAVDRLNATVTPHGFANYMEWISVAGSIATAYAFATEGGQMDQQMQDAIAAIRANPSMSDAQKQAMIQQMEAAGAAVAASRPPQETIDAVNAHAADLKRVFDEM